MPVFSKHSLKELSTCDEDLQKICNQLIQSYDFRIIQGYRGQKQQDEAYKAGRSQCRYPNSKHNKTPSMAVDIEPYPSPEKDERRTKFAELKVKFFAVAENLRNTGEISHGIRWGGDFSSFYDPEHFELE